MQYSSPAIASTNQQEQSTMIIKHIRSKILFCSSIFFVHFINGGEDPSNWLIEHNAQFSESPAFLSDQSRGFKIPSFQLQPYEKIPNKISEHRMDQLLKEAPGCLKGRNATLCKNTSGPLCNGNILLEGPAGSGKTSLALAIAYKCKSPFIFVAGSRLANSFKNSAPEFIEALFKALRTNCRNALIIDEFTAFTAKLNNQNDGDMGAVEDFWIALDQHRNTYNLIFMATTNEVDKIPAALQDRFGEPHHIGNPSRGLRLSILTDSPLATSYDVTKLANSTDGFSLRDLELLYSKAQDFANLRELDTQQNATITINDIQAALQHVKKSSRNKANRTKEKINKEKTENFNRQYLPLITFAFNTGITITGLIIQHYMTKENNAKAIALQKQHHKDSLLMQDRHHKEQMQAQEKNHQQNIQKQEQQFKESNEQNINFHSNSLQQSSAIGIAPFLGEGAGWLVDWYAPGSREIVKLSAKYGTSIATAIAPYWLPYANNWVWIPLKKGCSYTWELRYYIPFKRILSKHTPLQ